MRFRRRLKGKAAMNKPIVHFMIDRECIPNDRWLHVNGVIFLDADSQIEMQPVFIRSEELTDMMDAMQFIADEAYQRTLKRSMQ
jgi:hypothetical protein